MLRELLIAFSVIKNLKRPQQDMALGIALFGTFIWAVRVSAKRRAWLIRGASANVSEAIDWAGRMERGRD